MKKRKIIIILLLLVLIILIELLLHFYLEYRKEQMMYDNSKNIINIAKTLKKGKYTYESGILYDKNKNILNKAVFFDGNGIVNVDKYGNINMMIKTDKYCISKTYTKLVSINKGKCKTYKDIKYKITKNNNLLSFNINTKIDSYKLSKEDDFKGEFIKVNHEDNKNLVINFKVQGKYYIWFRDIYGNISDPEYISIDCFYSPDATYDKTKLYCIGSIINIDNNKYMIINSSENSYDILSIDSLNKLSHIKSEQIEESIDYKWSNSLINNYLNNEYYTSLSDSFKSMILEKEICDNFSGTDGCDSNDGCGGYKREVIEKYKWECSQYTSSKVRLMSYDEYTFIYDHIYDKSNLYGKYWLINTNSESYKGTSINDYEVYTKENVSNALDIRAVLTISK